MSDSQLASPACLVEHVWVADDLPPNGGIAIYDAQGKEDEDGTVKVHTLGVTFIWARFSRQVQPGQVATMTLGNIPGAFVMDGAATEWDLSTNEPTFADTVVTLISVERGVGTGRIVCRNTGDAALWIAVGVGVPIFRLPPQ